MNYLRLASVPLTDKERDINIFLNPGKHSQEKLLNVLEL